MANKQTKSKQNTKQIINKRTTKTNNSKQNNQNTSVKAKAKEPLISTGKKVGLAIYFTFVFTIMGVLGLQIWMNTLKDTSPTPTTKIEQTEQNLSNNNTPNETATTNKSQENEIETLDNYTSLERKEIQEYYDSPYNDTSKLLNKNYNNEYNQINTKNTSRETFDKQYASNTFDKQYTENNIDEQFNVNKNNEILM